MTKNICQYAYDWTIAFFGRRSATLCIYMSKYLGEEHYRLLGFN